jgi:threonine dehydrogenase-like Zn-dependent dehydrogenase
LAVVDRPVPALEAGDVLLEVDLCGVCASDLMALDGVVTDYTPPVVLGHEIAARVVDSHAEGVAVGSRVSVYPMLTCGECVHCRRDQDKYCSRITGVGHDFDGGFSDYVRVPGELVARGGLIAVPPEIPPERLLFLEPLACVVLALDETPLGETVAVLGAGPIGLLFAQLLLRRGVRTFVVEPMAHRREVARSFGVEMTVAPDAAGYAALREATSGGSDTVIVATEGASALDGAFAAVRRGGALNFFGLAPKGRMLSLELEQLHFQGYRIQASWAFSRASFAAARQWIVEGRVDFAPLLTHRFPLSQANEAIAFARERKGVKVALDPTMGDVVSGSPTGTAAP